jgi:hypothetical protein
MNVVMGGGPLKVCAVELRNGVLNLFGPKLCAITVSAAYPDAVGRVSDDELTDANFFHLSPQALNLFLRVVQVRGELINLADALTQSGGLHADLFFERNHISHR